MTLEEAIKIKCIWVDSGYAPPGPNEIQADNLSIEALKHVQNERATGGFGHEVTLPGLTEE